MNNAVAQELAEAWKFFRKTTQFSADDKNRDKTTIELVKIYAQLVYGDRLRRAIQYGAPPKCD